jgi:hypothetical protein
MQQDGRMICTPANRLVQPVHMAHLRCGLSSKECPPVQWYAVSVLSLGTVS